MGMSKKERVLAFVAIILTTTISLPPFYAGMLREEDALAGGMLLNDPNTNMRFTPLLPANNGTGPHEVPSFRNRAMPNSPRIVVIGDSQTYGIGEPLEDHWHSQLPSGTSMVAANW